MYQHSLDTNSFFQQAETKKSKPKKSLYAKATDTGVNIDWDTAAEIDSEDETDEVEVPPVVVSSHPNSTQFQTSHVINN